MRKHFSGEQRSMRVILFFTYAGLLRWDILSDEIKNKFTEDIKIDLIRYRRAFPRPEHVESLKKIPHSCRRTDKYFPHVDVFV
jgi:hypothetical protein